MWQLALGGALAGGALGALSTWDSSRREKAALEQQKKSAWSQYLLGKDYSDRQYGINRGEAQTQAAKSEYRLGQAVDRSVGEMNTALLAQAFGLQNAQIQTASGTGASLAAEGASGVRGSASGQMMRDYEWQNLDRGKDIQDRQNAQALEGLTTQAGNALSDIRYERDSWDPGGWRYAQKEAQDAYNLGMANLGQSNFNWQIDQATPQWTDWASGIASGASTGMSLAGGIGNISQFFTGGNNAASAGTSGGGGVGFSSYMTDYGNALGVNSNSFFNNSGFGTSGNAWNSMFNKGWF